jgi:hypothetical protein
MEQLREDEIRMMDRLVDGELSEPERRKLLGRFDDEPSAWRRCALAFLEAQSLRGDLSAFRSEPFHRVTRANGQHLPPWAWRLALAASLLAAFGLGTHFGGGLGRISAGPQSERLGPGDVAVDGDPLTEDQLAGASGLDPASPAWRTVKLGIDSGGDKAWRDVEVSFVEGNQFDPKLLQMRRPVVSAAVQQAFEQSGIQVREQRQLLPIELKDGRRLVLPVDQVELNYVGNREYQ